MADAAAIATTENVPEPSSVVAAPWRALAVAGALAVAAHLPLLTRLAKRAWTTEHYQFFPLVLLGAGVLAFLRFRGDGVRTPGGRWWRASLAGLSVSLLSLAVLLNSPWLGACSAMAALWAFVYGIGGRTLAVVLLPLWGTLWLAIPLPLGLDEQLIRALQRLATDWASTVLDLIGVRHLVAGVVVELPQRTFLVEEACSGIHSLFSALACTAFYLIYARRSFVRSLLIASAAVFWVVVANAARVTTVTVLSSTWDLPLTEGWGHESLGVILFAASLGLILSTDRLLLFLFPIGAVRLSSLVAFFTRQGRRGSTDLGHLSGQAHSRKREGWPMPASQIEQGTGPYRRYRVELLALSGFFAALAGIQFAWGATTTAGGEARSNSQPLKQLQSVELPVQWNDWRQIEVEDVTRAADDPNGQFSRVWHFERNGRHAVISVDGPFWGWHNLAGCLKGQGWRVAHTEHHTYQELGESLPGGSTELHLEKGISRYGFALFACFDEQDRPLSPSTTYVTFRAARRFPGAAQIARRITGQTREEEGAADGRTYQVQIYLETYVPLTEPEQEAARDFFHDMRRLITNPA